MDIKLTKILARVGMVALAVATFLVVIVTAGGIPTEPIAAAEGRGFAVIHFMTPVIQGPYTYPGGLPPYGIKVLDIDFSVTAGINSDDPNDPLAIRPEFSSITITKEFDQTSPDLNYYCALGQHFGTVMINMIPAGTSNPPPYYMITLDDAVITEVASRMVYRSSDTKYTHLETVSIKCGVIHWQHLTSGALRSWDLVHNEAP
jgi:type VI secretion system Hcp family effector